MSGEPAVLLDVKGLKKYFPVEGGALGRGRGWVRAVDDVSLQVKEGETLGLVGESGCGKSTLGRCILRLYEPTAGEIRFRDPGAPGTGAGARGPAGGAARPASDPMVSISAMGRKELRAFRANMQIIFQDPFSSLNPRMTVLEIIGEPLYVSGLASGRALEDRVKEMMHLVGLKVEHLRRYPHSFSGGQRQRIGIARALVMHPRLIIADEPVSALDVSIQAQTLNLLKDLQRELSLTYLFISHDLSVVRYMSDRIAVMYVGRMVEMAPTDELLGGPLHPYTETLLSAIPRADLDYTKQRIIPKGELPDPSNLPSGCVFHPRCRYAQDRCRQEVPQLREARPRHWTACHFADTLRLAGVQGQAGVQGPIGAGGSATS